jgi:hypothetical protein
MRRHELENQLRNTNTVCYGKRNDTDNYLFDLNFF